MFPSSPYVLSAFEARTAVVGMASGIRSLVITSFVVTHDHFAPPPLFCVRAVARLR